MNWDPGRVSSSNKVLLVLKMIRIEHTLFSLPFAYLGAVLSCSECLSSDAIILIFTAVLGLRTASMAFNNIADRDIDANNPRTSMRPLVTGAVSVFDAWLLVWAGSLLYFVSAYYLNWNAFLLSPILWVAAMTYPYHKRFLPVPHFHLGLVLGLVVFGGAIGVCGNASISYCVGKVPWIYVLSVTLWVAGFDIYYSIMDIEYDLRTGLKTLPSLAGEYIALFASRISHILAGVLFASSVFIYDLGFLGVIGTILGIGLLFYQHYIIWRYGVCKIPAAFNSNLFLGLVLSLFIVLDKLI